MGNFLDRWIPLFVFIFLPIINAIAQPKCKVEYYSTEQGLSHGTITRIIKDREGFMWFGTWDGINRFDGRAFVSYKSKQGEMSQTGDHRIAQLLEDQLGYLWIRTYYDHLYRFNKSTRQFLPIMPGKKTLIDSIIAVKNGLVWLQSKRDGIYCLAQDNLSKVVNYNTGQIPAFKLPSNIINVFYEDQDHRIWIGTPAGLACLAATSSGTYERINIIPHHMAGKEVTARDEDDTNVYFSTTDGNLVIYNKKTLAFSMHSIADSRINAVCRSQRQPVVYAVTTTGGLVSFNIIHRTAATTRFKNETLFSIYEDKRGALWIEPQDSGVLRYEPTNSSFSFFSQKIEDPSNVLGNRFKVFEDVNGLVWVNMKGGGFGYYNAHSSTMEFSLNAVNMPGFRMPKAVYNSYYDSTGVLYLRIHGRELVKIIFQEDNFKQQLLVDQKAELVDNEVRGILCDNKNRLWLASKRGSLHIRQDDKWIKGLFVNEPKGGIGNVYVIFQDSRGNIWLGTKGNGLFVARAVDATETKYRLQQYKPGTSQLPSVNVYTIVEDKKGRVWIGTFEHGLVMASATNDTIELTHSGTAFQNYPKDGFERIRHMTLDSYGNLWIGATDGLLVLDPTRYTYKAYGKVLDSKTNMGSSDIQFIFSDTKARMWLATSGGGLSLATGKPFEQLHFRNYTTADGLPNDYVLSCTQDKKGNLWIATENGLSRFDPDQNTFRNYNSYDGLPRTGFSEAAACRELANGNLVFGTSDGFITFDPDHVSMNPIAANIVFTSLQINKSGISSNTDINYTSQLTLNYNQNDINLAYLILDPRAGNRQAFAYRLVGFDSTWHTDLTIKDATYTNLPPGNYVFEVQSLYTDLYSNKPYKRLEITILPPPWKSWWAYSLYAILLLVILAVIRHYALKMVRLRHKMALEQKLAALKMNFFTGVSHELRTPLTLIVNPLEALAKKETLSAEGAAYVEVARKNANRMIRFINQLLDLRKVQSEKATLKISRVDIISFVQKISDHFTEAVRSKQLKLEIFPDQQELFAYVDAEKLDVIVYNLLSNAIKFTPDGKAIKIFIRSFPPGNTFSIAIQDQGPGVRNGNLESIFELFREGDHPAQNSPKGSGIGLALTKEFVNLHGGTIYAANNIDNGLTVTVTMYRDCEHHTNAELRYAQTATEQPGFGSIEPLQQNADAPLLLLVEDNTDLCQFLQSQLSEFYRVETAANGEEGWQKAVALLPDLIVSDVMMPVMDGIQLLDKVKNDLNTSHIPVVLLSAKYSIDSQIEALKYGADYYITKPFNNEFLVASIDNLLRQRRKLVDSLVQRKKPVALSPDPIVITSKDELFIKNVILTVEDKMADPEFRIETIAETMAMSQKTFYRKFKSLTALTPAEFVRDIRLQRARQYLDAGGNNVSDVAYLVGFTSPKYFSTCFKEKFQISPSDYIKSKPVPISKT